MADLARRVEADGWDGLALTDSQNLCGDVFAALAVAPVWLTGAQWIARAAAVPVWALIEVARLGAELPGAETDWPVGWFGAALLIAVTCAVVAAAALLRRPLMAAFLALCLLLVVLRPPPLARFATGWPPSGWRLVACDVGQRLSDSAGSSAVERSQRALSTGAGVPQVAGTEGVGS